MRMNIMNFRNWGKEDQQSTDQSDWPGKILEESIKGSTCKHLQSVVIWSIISLDIQRLIFIDFLDMLWECYRHCMFWFQPSRASSEILCTCCITKCWMEYLRKADSNWMLQKKNTSQTVQFESRNGYLEGIPKWKSDKWCINLNFYTG